ncbi:M24 family metallopeptidase [Actinophytocola oryzae]|uniref:Xaa-Pro aminopeptidase n=1 Tax=Actinophytocola oryzae TaxID=502181 RepID=A0A4V3FUP5_9PSEU|nr:Xaa-Pro peptidase family protein [Actinophytocola oryzae]TDV55971.1 Xaa-Pro aminopeptidase [Actinophytocola oryzae]
MATIAIPETPDIPRMRRETGARLRGAMAEQGVDALVLIGNSNVSYATGASWPLGDSGLAHVDRPVAVVLAGDEWPHLFMPFREGVAPDSGLPADHVHGPVYLEFDEGVEEFAATLSGLVPAGASVGVDELTGAMRRGHKRLFGDRTPSDAAFVLATAKVVKTPDELSCMRRALRITEEAMVDIDAAVAPGVRQIDLSAKFVRRAFELGATANLLDPIWQIMPASRAEGVWTTHGDLALPLLSTERELERGDVLWTDVSINYAGYCSDFGRTWCVGQDPSPRQEAQFRRWHDIVEAVLSVTRAGVTAADLTTAAVEANGDGTRPWVKHFYLGHGLGVDAAEMPFVGTDLGQEFDENLVLQHGSVLVLEPIAWEDGTGGYRGEEIIVITDDGYDRLTDYTYDPYGN